jgi:phosphoadenosine phosphosulfate reductase
MARISLRATPIGAAPCARSSRWSGLSVGRRAWVTGMRRVDAPTRTDIALVAWDARRGLVKLNPLAAWSDPDTDRYAAEHAVLLNPLRQLGYASIGCQPCTRPVAEGEDPRAGRWVGQAKTECGLHT